MRSSHKQRGLIKPVNLHFLNIWPVCVVTQSTGCMICVQHWNSNIFPVVPSHWRNNIHIHGGPDSLDVFTFIGYKQTDKVLIDLKYFLWWIYYIVQCTELYNNIECIECIKGIKWIEWMKRIYQRWSCRRCPWTFFFYFEK